MYRQKSAYARLNKNNTENRIAKLEMRGTEKRK